jgi:hypothetical protein
VLEKMGIQYRSKELEIRNNFPYRNFSRFEIEFEIKIQRASMNWISLENSLKFFGTLDFDEIWPARSLLHIITRKNQFLSKGDQKFDFHSKREFGLILR